MLDLSRVWPEWKAVEKIGEGSFGKVYKCEREEFGIKSVCAIKVISIPQSQAELESMSFEGVSEEGARTYYSDVVNDFANEIKLMEMLKGAPNVVNVENFRIVERENEIGWDIYIRMEYLQSFVSYSKNKKFTEEDVKAFALDISNALAVCAKNGVIHRDVKPDNIFIDKFGSFKLGDFGIARRLEGTMSVMSKKGTYSYMAPEVFRGEKYDCRADIYSLGMVMYKLLNRNRDPFIDMNKPVIGFKERNEAIERRRRGDRLPAPVDASPSMAAVILKACEFRADDRYASVEEFRAAILSVNEVVAAPVAPVAEEPTVAARDYFDKTVAARDFELPTPAPAQADFNDETVAVNYEVNVDELIKFAADITTDIEDDEATVMLNATDDPDATMIADDYERDDKAKQKKRKNKEEKQKNKKEKRVKKPKDKKLKEKKQKVKKQQKSEMPSSSQKFVNMIEIKYLIAAFLMGAFLIACLVFSVIIYRDYWYDISVGYVRSEFIFSKVISVVVLVLNVVSLCVYGVHKKKPAALIIGAAETTVLLSLVPTLFLCFLPVPILLITPLIIWTWIEQRKMSYAEFIQHNHYIFKSKFVFIMNYILFALMIACAVFCLFVGFEIILLLALCLCMVLSVAAIILNSLTQFKMPKLHIPLKIVSIVNFVFCLVVAGIYSAYDSFAGVTVSIVLAALSLIQTLLTVYADFKKLKAD